MKNEEALVILSGGQDSTTCLYWAIEEWGKGNVSAITFGYGQSHRVEIAAARKIAKLSGIKNHYVFTIQVIGGRNSPITNSELVLDEYQDFDGMIEKVGDRIEKTFVPLRNLLFLVHAAEKAIELDIKNLVIGVCQSDTANYPDCRKNFIDSCNETMRLALNKDINIITPLMEKNKKEIVLMAKKMESIGCWDALAYTHTSYHGEYPPIRKNHSNLLRAQGFFEAGLPDPLILRAVNEGLMRLPDTENYK